MLILQKRAAAPLWLFVEWNSRNSGTIFRFSLSRVRVRKNLENCSIVPIAPFVCFILPSRCQSDAAVPNSVAVAFTEPFVRDRKSEAFETSRLESTAFAERL